MGVLFPSMSSAAEISGRVIIHGLSHNADAVVYLEPLATITYEPPDTMPVMDQIYHAFEPRVLPVVVGTTVKFRNSDMTSHSVFTPNSTGDHFDLGTWMGKNIVKKHTFDKRGAVTLLCEIHSGMKGFIFVAPSPYFDKTNLDGKFTISGVPNGDYLIQAWAEQGESESRKITVRNSEVTDVNLAISVEDYY
ncbi:MAG: hypothetical protein GF372_11295 [Candidatus Marinimicrobia bacterium]|nr:hypothetical protein [Candidatus Neomarinimicrobiota bacterium]